MTDLDPQPPAIGPLLGSGRVADVHAYGAHALKLYHPGHGKEQAGHEAAILATLEGHGLPVPHVHGVGEYGGRWGLVMDRVDGGTLGSIALADAAPSGATPSSPGCRSWPPPGWSRGCPARRSCLQNWPAPCSPDRARQPPGRTVFCRRRLDAVVIAP